MPDKPAPAKARSLEEIFLADRGIAATDFRQAARNVGREGEMTASLARTMADLRNTALRQGGINNDSLSQEIKDVLVSMNGRLIKIIPDDQAAPDVPTLPAARPSSTAPRM